MTVPCVLVVARDVGLRWALVRLLARNGLASFDAGATLDQACDPPCRHPVTALLIDAGLLVADPSGGVASLQAVYGDAVVVVMSAAADHPGVVGAVAAGAVPLTAVFVEDDLVDLLRGGGGGGAGVRERRRPLGPDGHLAAARALPT